MDLVSRYQNVGVIGAAGKMGSGIALLLSQRMAELKQGEGKGKRFKLTLMDVQDEGLIYLDNAITIQIYIGLEPRQKQNLGWL